MGATLAEGPPASLLGQGRPLPRTNVLDRGPSALTKDGNYSDTGGYCFVVLSHDRRMILHVNITTNPAARWTAHQIQQAFPGTAIPTYLHRDGDGIYGALFRKAVREMGIEQVVSAPRSPWQNAFVERLIGTIRRECTNHILALCEDHLLQILREYAEYHNNQRPHQSLAGDPPIPRCTECGDGDIISTPVLGGLHHTYRRSA